MSESDQQRSDIKILDIGCGTNKHPGAIGLDNNLNTDADILHDLGVFPYPFPDNEFDEIVSFHVAEHLPDVTSFMNEIHRITKPGGRVRLVVPHYTNPDWPSDLTHRNHINSYSFRNFTADRQLFPFYTDAEFRLIRVYVTLANLWKIVGLQFLVNLDTRWSSMRFIRRFWEYYLCSVFRGKDIDFEFEVVKE